MRHLERDQDTLRRGEKEVQWSWVWLEDGKMERVISSMGTVHCCQEYNQDKWKISFYVLQHGENLW